MSKFFLFYEQFSLKLLFYFFFPNIFMKLFLGLILFSNFTSWSSMPFFLSLSLSWPHCSQLSGCTFFFELYVKLEFLVVHLMVCMILNPRFTSILLLIECSLLPKLWVELSSFPQSLILHLISHIFTSIRLFDEFMTIKYKKWLSSKMKLLLVFPCLHI